MSEKFRYQSLNDSNLYPVPGELREGQVVTFCDVDPVQDVPVPLTSKVNPVHRVKVKHLHGNCSILSEFLKTKRRQFYNVTDLRKNTEPSNETPARVKCLW